MKSFSLGLVGILVVGCGGAARQADSAESGNAPEPTSSESAEPASTHDDAQADDHGGDSKSDDDAASDDDDDDGDVDEHEHGKEASKKTSVPEPQFTEDMSVEAAIAAVPQGTSRLNMENDALSKPLTQPELYAPCKPAGSQHFKVRVAVWNGKAVGVDVTAKPANPKFAACIAKQVRSAEWDDKVPSLNTVEYSF